MVTDLATTAATVALPPVESAVVLSGMERLIGQGDLAALTPRERLDYYRALCSSLGLNPLTRPFEYLMLGKGDSRKLTLYARKDAAEQLRALHRVSVEIVKQAAGDGIYVTTARAVLPDGRTDEDLGAVPFPANIAGEERANAVMKSITKAKRRVTLSICGLGMLDETEVDSIAGAQRVTVDATTGEILSTTPAQIAAPAYDEKAACNRFMGTAISWGYMVPDSEPKRPSLARIHQALKLPSDAGALSAWVRTLERGWTEALERLAAATPVAPSAQPDAELQCPHCSGPVLSGECLNPDCGWDGDTTAGAFAGED